MLFIPTPIGFHSEISSTMTAGLRLRGTTGSADSNIDAPHVVVDCYLDQTPDIFFVSLERSTIWAASSYFSSFLALELRGNNII